MLLSKLKELKILIDESIEINKLDENKNGNRTIKVLLTVYNDIGSKLIYYLCNKGYTHASISFDNEETFYSFNYKGYSHENLEKYRRHGVTKSISYQLSVSDKDYNLMKEAIKSFEADKHNLAYTRLGIVLCCLGISFKVKGYYFCSQFVAEIMQYAIDLQKPPELYLPNDFCSELSANLNLKKVILNPV